MNFPSPKERVRHGCHVVLERNVPFRLFWIGYLECYFVVLEIGCCWRLDVDWSIDVDGWLIIGVRARWSEQGGRNAAGRLGSWIRLDRVVLG